jgi:S-adenosylmethionine decarboxylase
MTEITQTFRPAGTHLLLDFWGAKELADQKGIDEALREAAQACGATLIETKLHQFGDRGGVTGVALLAESHISIHTWPESGYAALDIFVCGIAILGKRSRR